MTENDCILNFKVYSNVFKDDEGVSVLSNEKQYPMTLDGKVKLEEELEYLKTVRRKEVVERIKTARSFGDLSENSEYDSAKEEQGFVEGRISTIESIFDVYIDTLMLIPTKAAQVMENNQEVNLS